MFRNAKQQGAQFAMQYIKENCIEDISEIVLAGMEYSNENFKSAENRQAFNEAVSDKANMIGRIQTRESVYGKVTPKSVVEAYQ